MNRSASAGADSGDRFGADSGDSGGRFGAPKHGGGRFGAPKHGGGRPKIPWGAGWAGPTDRAGVG